MTFLDGQYENSMTFCPPPLTMIVFSIIEIITFIIDIIHFRYAILIILIIILVLCMYLKF